MKMQAEIPVGDRAEVDVNGWITYPDNPISKEGVFPYLGKTLIAAGFEGLDPDAPYMVYRPGEELARQETIDSFKLVPWIIEHTHMGEGATDTDNVGIGGIVGEQVYYRDGVLYGNLKVFGDSQKQAIYKNGLKELSIGYTAQFDKSPGVWRGQAYEFVQRGIMGNHLASVQEGRSGPDIRVQDNSEVLPMDEETKARLEKLEQGHQEILAAIRELVDTKKKVEGEDEDEPKAADSEDEPKAADEDDADKAKAADSDEEMEKKAEAAVADALPRALAALRRRDALAGRVTKHIGVFDHADMTEAQVAKYAAGKLGVSLSTPDTLRAYLDGLDKAAGAAAPARVADSAVTGTLPAFLQKQLEA